MGTKTVRDVTDNPVAQPVNDGGEQVRRVSERRRETRERLMDAAFELVAERGMHNVSLQEISERAHFTRGAFHSNFESREELFAEMVDHRTRQQLEAAEQRVNELFDADSAAFARLACDRGANSSEIGKLVVDVLSSINTDPRLTIVVSEFQLAAQREPLFARMFLRYRRRLEADVVDFLSRAFARVSLRLSVPVELAAQVVEQIMVSGLIAERVEAVATGREMLTEPARSSRDLHSARERQIATLLESMIEPMDEGRAASNA